MKRLIDLEKLNRLDHLIRYAATGTPEQLAERLKISRSSMFELIAFLKDVMKAPIIYNRNRQSYLYSYTPKFYLGFERERLKTEEMNNTYGGIDKDEKKSKEIEIDNDKFILDEDIDFNELYY